jgi:hypothetical protein
MRRVTLKYLDGACRYLSSDQTEGDTVKRIILLGALALMTACGSTSNKAATGNTSSKTSTPAAAASNTATAATRPSGDTKPAADTKPTDDTITINDVSEMPPKCIELLGGFLKQIEPVVSKVDWKTATAKDMQSLGDSFSKQSDDFDAQMTAAACDKFNLAGSNKQVFKQMAKIAAAEAPGTLGFLDFISSLGETPTASAGAIPADCAGVIAALEPILAKGGSMQDLPIAEVTQISPLFAAVGTKCSSDEAAAFFARDDVTKFVGG